MFARTTADLAHAGRGSVGRWRIPENALRVVVFAAAYLIAYGYGLLFNQAAASPLWFPDSVLLCALVMAPRRKWWLYITVALAIRLFPPLYPPAPVWFVLVTSLSDVLKGILGAYLLLRIRRGSFRLATLRMFVLYLLIAVFLTPALSAFAGAAARRALGDAFWPAWNQWFIGDALANLVFTPTLLFWLSGRFRTLRTRIPETLLWAIGFSTSLICVVSFAHSIYAPIALYAPIPFLIWAAIRLGPIGASSAVSLIALFSMFRTYAPFRLPSANVSTHDLLLVQLFLAVATVPMLSVAILIEERGVVQTRLRYSQERANYRDHAAMQARLRLAAIVESSDDAIIGKDINGIITDWNNGAERLYGYSADEIIGKPISILVPADRVDEFLEIMRKIRAGETTKHFDTVRLKKDGTRVHVSLTVSPVVDTDGRIIGSSAIVRDISERKHQEAALRESEERLRMATQAGKMFAYEWDAATDKIVHSEGGGQILGEDEGTHITGQQILAMLPLEDREKLIAAGTQLSPEKPYLQIRHRMVRPDGTVIWVDENSRAYFDEHGRIVRIVGMVADVTDRVQAEEVLRQKDRELSEAQRLARVGSWYCDARNGSVTWSEELYRIAGLNPSLPAPTHKDEPRHFAAESWERMQLSVEEALRNGTPYELDLEMVRPDGTTRWVKTHGEPVSDTTGRIVALRGTAQDITERKLAEEALTDLSQKLIEAQEQERIRIARELHDDVSQQLALLSVELTEMKEALPASTGELRNRMNELENRTSEISSSVHSLSHELHSSKLEYLGMASAMKSFCKEYGDKNKVTVDFSSEGVPPTVPQEVSLCLFRVMQEALRNALKHSGERLFQVKLHGSPTELHLTVRDSGVGFDPKSTSEMQGLGLLSMQERAKLVKGTLSITSRQQSGTEISVRVPLSAGIPTESIKSAGA